MIINMSGSGIDNLKFRVYAATSLPASGKENDVCIITSTSISSWEAGAVDNPTWSMAAGFVYLTCDASDASQPNLLKKNALYLKLMRCWQYENGTWLSKDAYQYRNDTWVQFSTTFAATINITYPAGSVCTAICGSTTLTAPDTSGTWACAVPNAGTWEIVSGNYRRFLVIADGDNKTADVTKLFLFDNGDYCNNVTGGWTTKAWKQNNGFYDYEAVAPTINIQNGLMVIAPMKTSGYASGAILPVNDFDMGLYTKFCVKVAAFSCPSGQFIPYAAVSDRSIAYWQDAPAKLDLSSTGTRILSFSFGSGNKTPYVAIRCNDANANSILKISQMWLE